MASNFNMFAAIVASSVLVLFSAIHADAIGVAYGTLGNNLPSPSDVVGLYKSRNINSMRIYGPNQDILKALRGSGISLLIDVPNDQLQSISSNPSAAANWVNSNIKPYPDVAFRYIAVGNEVPDNQKNLILPAMQNIRSALNNAGLSQIKVSTSVATSVLGNSFPPSAGTFSSSTMGPIVQFLSSTGAPLLVNVYPYFSYVGNKGSISLNYALFTSPGTVVTDGNLQYQNLFDAIVDAIYAALEKTGGSNVGIVVSESGWPSAGGDSASVQNAQTYNQNLINHVKNGTPKRRGALETYIFALFNENQKPQGIEQNWGLFFPNKQPVYNINFS